MTDVAGAAGVSLKTVSRVVNEEPRVLPETATLVHEAIAQLGLRRNDIARALRHGQRPRVLGLLIEDVSNPFYSAIAHGVEEVAPEAWATRDRGQLEREPGPRAGARPPALRAAGRRVADRACRR